MSEFGLLIEYHYCTGCLSCEVACQQEHNHPAAGTGITVTEYVMETPNGLSIDYLPFPTALCDLCAARTQKGEQPAPSEIRTISSQKASMRYRGEWHQLSVATRTPPCR